MDASPAIPIAARTGLAGFRGLSPAAVPIGMDSLGKESSSLMGTFNSLSRLRRARKAGTTQTPTPSARPAADARTRAYSGVTSVQA